MVSKTIRTEIMPACNKVLPKAGLNGFDLTEVQGSTFVLRLNFSAKIPRLRQYPKRCLQAKKRTDQNKDSENDEIFIFCQHTFKDKIAYAQMAHLVFANTQANASKNQKSHFFTNAPENTQLLRKTVNPIQF